MNIYESAEDYLERILMVRERKGIVYWIDVVHELNFSKSSVSVAMKRLRENGYSFSPFRKSAAVSKAAAVAMSAQPDMLVVLFALVETLLFLGLGLWMAKNLRYE